MMIAGGVIGGKRPSIAFMGMLQNLSINQSSYTYNNVPFGGASANRYMLIGLVTVTSGPVPNNMTIGGVSGSRHATIQAGALVAQIWGASVPAGESGTVAFSVPSGDMDRSAIYVWSAYDLRSATPVDTATYASTPPADVSVDVAGNGLVVAVAVATNVNNVTITFTGVSNDSQTSTNPFIHSGGHASQLAAAAPHTITALVSTGAAPLSVAASFR